jgi:hypothetical protein
VCVCVCVCACGSEITSEACHQQRCRCVSRNSGSTMVDDTQTNHLSHTSWHQPADPPRQLSKHQAATVVHLASDVPAHPSPSSGTILCRQPPMVNLVWHFAIRGSAACCRISSERISRQHYLNREHGENDYQNRPTVTHSNIPAAQQIEACVVLRSHEIVGNAGAACCQRWNTHKSGVLAMSWAQSADEREARV